MKRQFSAIIAIYLLFVLLFTAPGCSQRDPETADQRREDTLGSGSVWPKYYGNRFNLDTISPISPASLALEDAAKSLQRRLIEVLPKISLTTGRGEEQITRNYYVVEGDIRLDVYNLYVYCQKRLQRLDTSITEKLRHNKLTLETDRNGRPAIWPVGATINYCVMRNSFHSRAHYDSVVNYMRSATSDWMRHCNIRFQHLTHLDNTEIDLGATTESNLFVVRQFNANGDFIAQAFFPTDAPFERVLLLDNSFFNTDFSRTGILRHELGHVLGFRHEHIWSKDESCKGEDVVRGALTARLETSYDPYSVMHYPCGPNANNRSLELTEFDRTAARKVYPF